MTSGQKIQAIRRDIEAEFPTMDYLERERIVRPWIAHPLSVFRESLDAGFATVEGNPYVDPNVPLSIR